MASSATDATYDPLFYFLKKYAERHNHSWVLKPGTIVKMDGESITIPHLIIRRQCKNKTGYRIEFVSEHVVKSGKQGTLVKVDKTICTDDGKFKEKFFDKNGDIRLVKIQQHKAIDELQYAGIESQLGGRVEGHGIKPAVIDGYYSYIVMRFLNGVELFDLIFEITNLHRSVTYPQLCALSLELAQTIKREATDLGIIHRDIKPENFLFEFAVMKGHLVDYGLSIDVNTHDGRMVGTPVYVSPEIINQRMQHTVKMDVYSLGMILRLIWGDLSIYAMFDLIDKKQAVFYIDDLGVLFEAEHAARIAIPASAKLRISHIVEEMQYFNYFYRSSIEDVIAVFKSLLDESVALAADAAPASSSESAPDSSSQPVLSAENPYRFMARKSSEMDDDDYEDECRCA